MSQPNLEQCLVWATGLYAEESDVHRWVVGELEARGLPRIQVSPLEGKLLGWLAAAVGAERLLEIGTLGGYSGLWLLSLLPPSARLTTIEVDPAAAKLAREAFHRAGVAERVRVLEGDARDVLRTLAAGPTFDLAFIDADKEGYPEYLERCRGLVRAGGLILGDNAFWDGRVVDPVDTDAATRAVREFNRRLAGDAGLDAVVVPIRDGLAMARVRGSGADGGST